MTDLGATTNRYHVLLHQPPPTASLTLPHMPEQQKDPYAPVRSKPVKQRTLGESWVGESPLTVVSFWPS